MLDRDDFVIAALLEEGLVDRAAVDAARAGAVSAKQTVCEALVAQGIVGAQLLAIVRAQTCECAYVELSHYDIAFANSDRLPRQVAESLVAFPLFIIGESVTVGMVDPLDLKAVDQLRALLKKDIDPVLCEPGELRRLIEQAYSLSAAGAEDLGGQASVAALTTGKEPIVAAVNQILAQAVEKRASDVHIGADEHDLHVRLRIDGTLHAQQAPALSAHAAIVRRLKVMGNLDLTQTRRPQDGKFRFTHRERTVDVRLSIIPTVTGENAVLRLLSSAAAIKGFADLGFPAAESEQLQDLMRSPYGMLLVTGPTGSGKTTTVYTALKQLNTPDRHVVTIEDPVEIRLPLLRQVQVNAEIGMTFAGALRSILRQDPDVVFVGEIRDEETARIAVQAALTGHIVLSTLHTNDAAGALPRLRDFNCPAFALNAALLAVIAQRLVRRVCPDCARPAEPDPKLLARFGVGTRDGQYQRGAGCGKCGNSGFRGRVGIYEMLRLTPAIQRVVESGGDSARVRAAALENGMTPMWVDGLHKAQVGLTTLEEVARVVAVMSAETGTPLTATRVPDGTRSEVRLSA